ncbi:GNAT family N-acetyltransferase [Streptomyces niger]|uniref:GNAT family N-acetyltransferase n=1 Tax=Streptomyces niger TaxID=66373 RepID=UPI00069B89D7|nr:GNAT family N-acetyltransferase [Streptomyces niger]
MTIRFHRDPAVTPELRDGVCALWADVSNAGGAVGFVPPVTREDIRPELVKHLAAMAEGRARLIVGQDASSTPLATAFVYANTHRLMRHWLWVYSVMVHPSLQGQGVGRELMAAVEDAARDTEGIRGLRLTCRGGTGADRFYGSCGYKEVGRVPDAIKVADDDYRDDITMWREVA